MSKSTPLAHLPSMTSNNTQSSSVPAPGALPPQVSVLLNDPQRQTQSQSTNPQLQDADEIIQETLNQLNAQNPISPPQQQSADDVMYNMQQQNTIQYDPNLPTYAMEGYSSYDQMPPPPTKAEAGFLADMLPWLNNDVQAAFVAAILYVVISVIPVEKLVYKYIALDKVPYSHHVIKAVLLFVATVVILKLLKL